MATLRASVLRTNAFKPAVKRVACARTSVVVRASSTQQTQKEVAPSSAMISLMSSLMIAGPALADDSAAVAPVEAATSFSPSETFILFAPLAVYAMFWFYRERFNPKATLGDLALFAALAVILFNLFSIVVFKVRYF
eukprot:CAMPEP_0202867244 /NCGR_PEP_ID=MMETSP1391-20130828/8999_1 /ASSEMBLY_ACC=CAM_ASM_000867 /TAXON_ID=1034604 /ORGANISM="Chlamydomonas leiostraca, Strain SAG 11-49" /LENGTH=136 /DNA_ID=CAMNT_0049547265 /DNA_START=16 /DNA_END=426 /DNA_ORIENTATION=-